MTIEFDEFEYADNLNDEKKLEELSSKFNSKFNLEEWFENQCELIRAESCNQISEFQFLGDSLYAK